MATIVETTTVKQRALNVLDNIEHEFSQVHPMAEVATNMLRGWIESVDETKMTEEFAKLHTLLGVILHGAPSDG